MKDNHFWASCRSCLPFPFLVRLNIKIEITTTTRRRRRRRRRRRKVENASSHLETFDSGKSTTENGWRLELSRMQLHSGGGGGGGGGGEGGRSISCMCV